MNTNMRAIADRYRARADAFQRKVAAVQPEQWSNKSPCEDWTARDVVRHIIDMHGMMLQPLDRQLSLAPSLDDDPLGAFTSARADVQAVLDDPELGGTEQGRESVEHIDEAVSVDLVIHGWDLARATGQDDTIDPGDVELVWSIWSTAVEQLGDEILRTPGVFGPRVKVTEDAPLQDRLLGLLGRHPG
jgi:uncharacterized protein (TIGR03086 family)